MTVLSAQTIRFLCQGDVAEASRLPRPFAPPPVADNPMIFPFVQRGVTGGKSYGLSCAGYDVRLAQDLTIPPKTMRLGSTMERFIMPPGVLGRVHDKSSWARCALFVHNTVIEPGWRGYLTLEIKNDSWLQWKRLKRGTPIAQIVFERLDFPTDMPYRGKYQDQREGPVPAIDEPDGFVFTGYSCGR